MTGRSAQMMPANRRAALRGLGWLFAGSISIACGGRAAVAEPESVPFAPTIRSVGPAPAACVVTITMDWGRRSFVIEPDGIHGSGVSLRRNGNIISGFVFGGATRLLVASNRLSGKLGGSNTEIKISTEDREIQLRGSLPEIGKAVVISAEWKLEIYSEQLSMNVLREPSGLFRGEVKIGQHYSDAELRLAGCSQRILWQRPILALVLAMAPMAR